ncbi:MAG: hypothetical protein KBB65_01155 [Syntrophorhabdaceae bacterium]|nr:hypothetical protein [Syntrophorhabdaceae bacterium]
MKLHQKYLLYKKDLFGWLRFLLNLHYLREHLVGQCGLDHSANVFSKDQTAEDHQAPSYTATLRAKDAMMQEYDPYIVGLVKDLAKYKS